MATAARRPPTAARIRTGRGSTPAASGGNSNTCRATGFPCSTRKGKVGLGMCSEAYMPEATRDAGLAGRRIDLYAGRHRQGKTVGELAQLDLVACDRESRHRGHHAEPVQPCRARADHGGGRRSCSRGRRPGCSSSMSASNGRARCAPAWMRSAPPHSTAPSRGARAAMAASRAARGHVPRPLFYFPLSACGERRGHTALL